MISDQTTRKSRRAALHFRSRGSLHSLSEPNYREHVRAGEEETTAVQCSLGRARPENPDRWELYSVNHKTDSASYYSSQNFCSGLSVTFWELCPLVVLSVIDSCLALIAAVDPIGCFSHVTQSGDSSITAVMKQVESIQLYSSLRLSLETH